MYRYLNKQFRRQEKHEIITYKSIYYHIAIKLQFQSLEITKIGIS